MRVRMAYGSEMKREKLFINPDGTSSSPEEYFGRKRGFNPTAGRNNPQIRTGKEEEGATQSVE